MLLFTTHLTTTELTPPLSLPKAYTVQSPALATANANSAVTLSCSINYSDTPPTIVWFKEDVEVTEGVTSSQLNSV